MRKEKLVQSRRVMQEQQSQILAVQMALVLLGVLAVKARLPWLASLMMLMMLMMLVRQVIIGRGGMIFKRDITHPAPGSSWMKYINFFYSKKFVEGTIKPVMADWHYEYFEALQEGRRWKARWVSVRYHWAMIETLWLGKAWEMVEKVFGLIKS